MPLLFRGRKSEIVFTLCTLSAFFLCHLVGSVWKKKWRRRNGQSWLLTALNPPLKAFTSWKTFFFNNRGKVGDLNFVLPKKSSVWTGRAREGHKTSQNSCQDRCRTPPETFSLLFCSFLWYFSYFYTSVQWIIKNDDEYYAQIVTIAIEEPEVLECACGKRVAQWVALGYTVQRRSSQTCAVVRTCRHTTSFGIKNIFKQSPSSPSRRVFALWGACRLEN